MISVKKFGRGFRGLGNYLLSGNRGAIIGGNLAGRTPRELSAEVAQFRKLRPTLGRAVAHFSLSAAPEDPIMDNATWMRIADRFITDLGFANCSRVVIRHSDAHEHIHIACLRITAHGRTVPDANDQYKAERSLARIEADFGLRRVNVLKEPRQKEKRKPAEKKAFCPSINDLIPPPKEKGMKDENTAESAGAGQQLPMPEPLNIGTDMAQHAFALAHGATVMTCWAGDNPNERQRRDIKRVLRNPGYDNMVKHLLDPDVSAIFHHQRGSVIYLKRPERIADDGDRLTAYNMDHQRAARAMVALACSRGWTAIVFNGPDDFIREAMAEALAQGIPIHPRDAQQRIILYQVMAANGGANPTAAIPMAFQSAEPSFPHEPIHEPAPAQQVPSSPEVPEIPIQTNLASKLAQRRQQIPSDDVPGHRGPKGP